MDLKQRYWIRPKAREMRKAMTKEERRLWHDFLKGYPVNFMRQRVIGNYVVDFYCPKARLILEIDGTQHYEEWWQQHDNKRTEYLESLGLKVLRFSNRDVNQDFRGVCEQIDFEVNKQI